MKEIEYIGKDKQLKQVLWERGKYVEGMVLTTKEKSTKKENKATRNNDRRWNVGDIVFFEDVDTSSDVDPELFRVTSVPKNHINVKSAQDVIDIEFLEFGNKKKAYGVPAGCYYYPSRKTYKQKAKDLSAVKPNDFNVVLGKVSNKMKYWISMNVSSVWARMNGKEEDNVNAVNVANVANDDPVIVANPNPNNENKLNPLDMREVWSQTPTAKNIKSLIERLITDHDLPPASRRGHGLLMSAKFHCECAGVGIEYCFGRVKWWYNKFHRHSNDGLREDSEAFFLAAVVSIHHMRKFARKSRDYMRVYRATKDWPDDGGDIMVRTENCIKALKTHRCAMDTDLVFVSENIEAAPVDYNK